MSRNILLCLATFMLFGLSLCYSQESIKNLKDVIVKTEILDSFLVSQMDSLKIPGLSIAIINEAKVSYHQVYGYANIEKKLPVTKTTIFEGASMSKSVFATFVMTFVEEGKLALDKPLYTYLPYDDIAHDERYKKITARMVLSHRSGFPNWRENEEGKKLRIKFDPDTDYGYSGEGYQYLAMVLKQIENTDWNGLEEIFQQRIAKPLGLQHTTFIEDVYALKNKAEPYNKAGKWIDWKKDYWYLKDKGIFVAPASIRTEPLDFSKWMIAVMNQEILKEESYLELLKPHSTVTTLSNGTKILYSLGFITADGLYKDSFFHGGSNDGFTCWYMMDIEKKWGYVLFTNSMFGEKLGEKLWDYLDLDSY
ncbi:serine hydrolase domain-containing protein [Aquimarina litoralis]|uniref:serine hydrolase domain-containing protein n=1 Tax=Aquimarina litoralis TaxID=584605 RepID=UPI001C55EC2E|nr:serine hydrolase domain-containing protein [Aquimarina litoralis]MBW1296446.1 serine hydrolase [Aquimarina litoralis]